MRLILALAALSAVAASIAHANGHSASIERRVHDAGVCWDPDVEFPVPCDSDDD